MFKLHEANILVLSSRRYWGLYLVLRTDFVTFYQLSPPFYAYKLSHFLS